ncbi:MAG TPA: hypothetical protein VN419_07725 [Humidesulfovibrio sp.]|uniref:hypothetical protein n=1 Tax=Humidesulfovibrio sp. TaxID=2910988 RepID=UPI002BB54F18|nr:hypothetical protein [Humidesulfovibrio sp.]HWR03895.1 hypothetical protein [Humidesulfovibrio sp.]
MTVLLWGLALLCGALAVHVLWWRTSLPRNQLAALLKLLLAVLALWLGANALLGLTGIAAAGLPLPLIPCLHAGLLYISAALAYVVLFSTIDADSPSINILRTLDEAGPQGLGEDELLRRTGMERFFISRLERMEADGMTLRTPRGLAPGAKGSLLLGLVLLWRVIMGAPKDLD